MRRLGSLLVLGLLCVPQLSWGQFGIPTPVFEIPGPMLTTTTFTTVLTNFQLVEDLFNTAEWILELTPYSDNGLGGFAVDVAVLDSTISETQSVLWETNRLLADMTRLFSPGTPSLSTTELDLRLMEIRTWRFQQQLQAQRVQTLPGRIKNVLGRMMGLLERILDITGGKQGSQQQQAMLQQLQLVDSQTQVVEAAYNQAMLSDVMEQPMIDASLREINKAIYATMPR